MIQFDYLDPTHCFAVMNWWTHMEDHGEIDKVFMPDMNSPVRFFQEFMAPSVLYFLVDDEGIYFAAWYQPFIASVWQGIWIREDKRKSKSVLVEWVKLMRKVFGHYPTILGVTKQAHLIEQHKKLGYNVSLIIPGLFGEYTPGWIVALPRDQFKYLKETEGNEPRKTIP